MAGQKRQTRRNAPVRYRDVSVSGVAPGGWGFADVGRARLLVRDGVPGDRLNVRVVRRERGRTEAIIEQVLARSAKTVPAPCTHFAVCGGCVWQHLAYAEQLACKRDLVQRCFSSARLDAGFVAPVLGGEPSFFYRNKMDFTFGCDRSGAPALGLFESPAKVVGGFAAAGRDWVPPVFDVATCWLQSEVGNRIVAVVRRKVIDMALPIFNAGTSGKGLRSLILREGKQTGEWLVLLMATDACREDLQPVADAVMAAEPDVRGVVLCVNPKRSKNAAPLAQITLAGQAWIRERILDCDIRVSPTSFLQVNTRQAERLYAQALTFAELTAQTVVMDLYCGTGTLSLLLARRAHSVVGIEVVAPAVADARENAAQNGIGNCRFVCGDVLDAVPECAQAGLRPEVVTVNPPRAGIFKAVVRQICMLNPERIVYISCNPETLVRDLIRFGQGGYRPVQVQPVDLFPHTPHVEVVVKLEKKSPQDAGR